VTLAVGRHVRLPRRYRGRDVMWWLDRTGSLAERAGAVPDLQAARRRPSLQLVGRPDHRSLDLGVLAAAGVRLAGRLVGVEGGRVRLADDLPAYVEAAERRMARLLRRIDAHVARTGEPAPTPRPIPAPIAPPAPRALDLGAEGIRTVLWATGYRRSYPWLRLPVLDAGASSPGSSRSPTASPRSTGISTRSGASTSCSPGTWRRRWSCCSAWPRRRRRAWPAPGDAP
jgi:putative flavoprotein involved in K+ transport